MDIGVEISLYPLTAEFIPPIEEMLTTEPPPFSFITRAASRVPAMTPSRSMPMT